MRSFQAKDLDKLNTPVFTESTSTPFDAKRLVYSNQTQIPVQHHGSASLVIQSAKSVLAPLNSVLNSDDKSALSYFRRSDSFDGMCLPKDVGDAPGHPSGQHVFGKLSLDLMW